jgi:hypothetical protein
MLKFFATLFVALLPLLAPADTLDLKGIWVSSEGDTRTILQEGDKVKGIDHEDSSDWGSPPGFTAFSGTFDGREFVGKLARWRLAKRNADRTLKLSVAEMKSRCGDRWRYLSEMNLTLSADGRTLKGSWLDEPHDFESCQPSGKTFWVPISFTRKAGPPPAAKTEEKARPAVPAPADLPKLEAPVLAPVAEPAAAVQAPAGNKNMLIGGILLALLAVLFFFIRNAYANYLVGSLKRAPNAANLAGWALFGSFFFASAIGSLALGNDAWLSLPVLVALAGLSTVCLGLCVAVSRKK